MLDAARHFLPMADVRRMVDAMALLRLNVLHLHLTDDQGWRFESRMWPRLTEVGAWRDSTVVGHPGNYRDWSLHPENHLNVYGGGRHGGFYTQSELRELVVYARERGVTVVPEIDMPGHMRAARAAYPELGYDAPQLEVGRSWGVYPEVLRVDEAGLAFCTDILGEVVDVFDAPYVHIGGDECPKTEWEASPVAEAQRRDLGLSDVAHLQRWFTGEIAGFLMSRGRRLVGWDEIIDEGVPDGDPVVMAAVYAYDPYAGLTDPDHLIGLQAQLWSEYIPTADHLWYMAFPRLVALADIGWYGTDRPPYEEFRAGLPSRLEALADLGVGHRPL